MSVLEQLSETMATKQTAKTTFEAVKAIRPIFTGGPISINSPSTILATTNEENVMLTDPATGRRLAEVEGVRSHPAAGDLGLGD